MSAYKNFRKDFVERTIHNLKWLKEQKGNKYEHTMLLNQCLGLILLPQQFLSEEQISRMPQDLSHYHLELKDIEEIEGDDYSFSSVLRHLRNGIAHGRIEQIVEGGDIIGIKIEDRCNSKSSIHTIIHIDANKLEDIALAIATAYCETFPDANE